MHELSSMPSIPVTGKLGDGTTGVVGMQVRQQSRYADDTVRLLDGARQVLYELATEPRYREIVLAAASSSLEPSYSQVCLEKLEIRQGLTLADMLSFVQIGRTGKLSPDKRTHFRQLHEESGVDYEEMLFFDDCNWGDHVGVVQREFGVVGQRTPAGLDWHDFQQGMESYHKQTERRLAGY